ncbi:MAG: cytochrome-c oxidase, cbb3-type subunit II [Pseudomonadales bacterium]
MKHEVLEKNIGLMILFMILAISFGTLVELVPLMMERQTREPAEGLEPLAALPLEGRDIYIREGCNNCHSQMIRTLRSETERYGHYTMANELVYNHPHLWGSKRTGPDLARVGGRYSNDWHRLHLFNPRDVVPESNMPSYPWLFERTLDGSHTAGKMKALRMVGVPYKDSQIANAANSVDGKTEADALIAYLQQLGLLFPRS